MVPCHYLGPYQYSQDEGRGRYRHFIIIIIIIIIGSVGGKDNNSASSSTFSYNNSTNGSNIRSSEVVWTTTSQQQGRRRGGIPAMPHPRQEGGRPGINVTSSRYYLMDRTKSRLPTRHKARALQLGPGMFDESSIQYFFGERDCGIRDNP